MRDINYFSSGRIAHIGNWIQWARFQFIEKHFLSGICDIPSLRTQTYFPLKAWEIPGPQADSSFPVPTVIDHSHPKRPGAACGPTQSLWLKSRFHRIRAFDPALPGALFKKRAVKPPPITIRTRDVVSPCRFLYPYVIHGKDTRVLWINIKLIINRWTSSRQTRIFERRLFSVPRREKELIPIQSKERTQVDTSLLAISACEDGI